MSLIELELPERFSALIDIDAFRDLVEQWEWGCVEPTMSPPLCLGWDIHRQWLNAEGFAIWRDLMHAYEPPLLAEQLPPGSPLWGTTSEKYEAYLVETWSSYDREKHWVDHLIVDEMFSSLERGYEPCGVESVVLRTEAILDDLAAKVGARRAAEQETRDTRQERRLKRIELFYELDDAGYAKWIADGMPFLEGMKWVRWDFRRAQEISESLRGRQCEALPPIPAHITEQYKAAPMLAPLSPLPSSPVDLLKTSGEFVHGFVPPEYLIDGVLQRRFCYSMTAQTGIGKTTVAMRLMAHVDTGRRLGNLDVEKGTVLYLAGENPTDIQMRWLGLTKEMGIDPATADVHFLSGAMPLSGVAERITAEVTRKGLHLALVVVDTAAAYFEGDNENDNAQAVQHARRMRSLTELPGGPCVLVLCHPTKRAGDDDLIPRGGGAFLAEVDGNIALQKRESLVAASVQGKFRGREFSPLHFELKTVFHPTLKDARGRDIPTVIARPVDETGKQQMAQANRTAEDNLLKAIFDNPRASLRSLAVVLGWLDSKQQPNAMKVSRSADVLARDKLIRKHRASWELTEKGQIELNRLDAQPKPASMAG